MRKMGWFLLPAAVELGVLVEVWVWGVLLDFVILLFFTVCVGGTFMSLVVAYDGWVRRDYKWHRPFYFTSAFVFVGMLYAYFMEIFSTYFQEELTFQSQYFHWVGVFCLFFILYWFKGQF